MTNFYIKLIKTNSNTSKYIKNINIQNKQDYNSYIICLHIKMISAQKCESRCDKSSILIDF